MDDTFPTFTQNFITTIPRYTNVGANLENMNIEINNTIEPTKNNFRTQGQIAGDRLKSALERMLVDNMSETDLKEVNIMIHIPKIGKHKIDLRNTRNKDVASQVQHLLDQNSPMIG